MTGRDCPTNIPCPLCGGNILNVSWTGDTCYVGCNDCALYVTGDDTDNQILAWMRLAHLRKFEALWRERLGDEGTTQSAERLDDIDRRAKELLEADNG